MQRDKLERKLNNKESGHIQKPFNRKKTVTVLAFLLAGFTGISGLALLPTSKSSHSSNEAQYAHKQQDDGTVFVSNQENAKNSSLIALNDFQKSTSEGENSSVKQLLMQLRFQKEKFRVLQQELFETVQELHTIKSSVLTRKDPSESLLFQEMQHDLIKNMQLTKELKNQLEQKKYDVEKTKQGITKLQQIVNVLMNVNEVERLVSEQALQSNQNELAQLNIQYADEKQQYEEQIRQFKAGKEKLQESLIIESEAALRLANQLMEKDEILMEKELVAQEKELIAEEKELVAQEKEAKYEESIQKLRSKLSKRNERIEEHNQIVKQFEEDLLISRNNLQVMKEERDHHKTLELELEAKMEAEIETSQQFLERNQQELEFIQNNYTTTRAKLRNQLAESKENLELLEFTHTATLQEVIKLNTQIAQREEAFNNKNNDLEKLNQAYTLIQNDFHAMKAERDHYVTHNLNLKEEIEAMTEAYQHSNVAHVLALREKEKEKEDNIQIIEGNYTAVTEERDDYKNRIAHLEQEIHSSQQLLKISQKENEQLNELANKISVEKNQLLEEQQELHSVILTTTQAELQKLTTERNDLQNCIVNLETQIQDFHQSLEKKERDSTLLEDVYTAALIESEYLKGQITEKEEVLNTKNKMLEELKQVHAFSQNDLQLLTVELEHYKTQALNLGETIEKLIVERNQEQNKAVNLEEEIEAMTEAYQHNNIKYTQALKEKETEVQRIDSHYANIMDSLRNQLTKTEEELEEKKDLFEKLKNEDSNIHNESVISSTEKLEKSDHTIHNTIISEIERLKPGFEKE